MNQNQAEAVALNVLNFLADDEVRLARFMNLSGIDLEVLRGTGFDRNFLAGILDYLLQDETLIYLFADAYNATPDLPAKAHRALSGDDSGEFQ